MARPLSRRDFVRTSAAAGLAAAAPRALAQKAPGGVTGRRLWESLEAESSRRMADALRREKLRVPIAGVSHWRQPAEHRRH